MMETASVTKQFYS